MAKLPDYPGVSSFKDRHGKTRYSYRGPDGKTKSINAEPHSREFDAIYQALTEGRSPTAQIIQLEGTAKAQTFKHAYQLLKQTTDWKRLEPKSQRNYSSVTERLLRHRIGAGCFGDAPVADLRRRDAIAVLNDFADGATTEWRMLICLRKLIVVALDQEWIVNDPTLHLKRPPTVEGHATWTAEHMARFEAHWPAGSPQRTAYALGLWLGNRVSDVAKLRWDCFTTKQIMWQGEMIRVEGFEFVQHKGRKKKKAKALFLPITPMLAEHLNAVPRGRTPFVVANGNYDRGYTIDSLSQGMSRWAREAGLPAGYTMHGLRKALGAKLAEADATTRQLMDVLGHSSIEFAALYSVEASQIRMSYEAMDKLTKMELGRGSHLKVVV
jgi:integrase